MIGKDAINMFEWTRRRLIKIIEALPEEALDFKPNFKMPKGERIATIRSMLSHIIGAETGWIWQTFIKKPAPSHDLKGLSKTEIIEKLQSIRKMILEWLNKNIDRDFEKLGPRAKRPPSWVLHHVIEHEAHHIGQIVMIAAMAGYKTPWV